MEGEMSFRYLFHPRQAMVALFILSWAATTQSDILNDQYKAGIGPSEKIQLPQPFDHAFYEQCFQSHRLAQRTNAYASPGFRGELVR
jgi:hypothetical protein